MNKDTNFDNKHHIIQLIYVSQHLYFLINSLIC